MSDLTDFLLARYAEDESTIEKVWEDNTEWLPGAGIWTLDLPLGAPEHAIVTKERAAAEVAAKRAILDLHKPVLDAADGTWWCDMLETSTHSIWPCSTIRALAAVYADHPDYREEWAL
jgi:hypothetical protein